MGSGEKENTNAVMVIKEFAVIKLLSAQGVDAETRQQHQAHLRAC